MLSALITPVPPLYSLFLYLGSLWVLQPLGTVHIQEEILQQGLSFLQVPGILCLELKSLVLLVIAGVLEAGDTEEKAWLDTGTSPHFPWPAQRLCILHRAATEEPLCPGCCPSSLPARAFVGQAGSPWGCAATAETALAVQSLRH